MAQQGMFVALKCAFGKHAVSEDDKRKMRAYPESPIYTSCASSGCDAKLKLYIDETDRKHFFVKEI